MKINRSNQYVLIGAILFLVFIGFFTSSNYWLSLFTQAIIYTMLAVSLQLIFGYAGQISLAHAAFFGIGAYTSAILTLHYDWPFILAFFIAGIMAAVVSLVLSPMARLREVYFAMSSLAFNLIMIIIFSNGGKLTGGWNGLVNVPYPNIFGWVVDTKKEFFIIAGILLIIQYVFMIRLTSGRLGRNFRAIRDNQLAASSIGVNIGLTKSKGFILGCFWAGLAGSLMVHMYAFVSPEPFAFGESVNIVLMVVLGGLGSFPGAVLGGLGVTFLNEWLKEIPLYRPIIYGLFVVVMMIFWPGGLYALVSKFKRKKQPSTTAPQNLAVINNEFSIQKEKGEVLLQTEGVSKFFGGVKAVRGVSLEVRQGDIFGMIGPNGAGKTTFINIVTGLEPPTSGQILFDGKDLTKADMSKVSQQGMVRTFQTSRLFNSMTVLENVVAGTTTTITNDIGMPLLQNKKFQEEEERAYNIALYLIRFVGLEQMTHELCGNLAYGHRRLVEIARAIASKPKLLLMDEPAAGLNLKERHELCNLIKRIRDEFGITVFIVEHDLKLLLEICDQMAVLNFGEKIADGNPYDVVNDEQVVQAYLGRRSKEYA